MSDEPERLDAPNQQVVRADGSAPWEEGSGGQPAAPKSTDTEVSDEEPDDAPKPKASAKK